MELFYRNQIALELSYSKKDKDLTAVELFKESISSIYHSIFVQFLALCLNQGKALSLFRSFIITKILSIFRFCNFFKRFEKFLTKEK